MATRSVLERQLTRAEQSLAQRVDQLKASGRSEQAANDPQWRHLDADCNALRRRIRAIEAVEANNSEVARRKEVGDEAEEG